jgi:large subunit ribosomal protein L13
MEKAITIDAKGKSIGRVASEASKFLQGKHLPDFAPHKFSAVKVNIENLSGAKFTGKKFDQKVYHKHTGYIGHLKETKLKELWQKDPKKVFFRALNGMLPKNKMRKRWLKNVKVSL